LFNQLTFMETVKKIALWITLVFSALIFIGSFIEVIMFFLLVPAIPIQSTLLKFVLLIISGVAIVKLQKILKVPHLFHFPAFAKVFRLLSDKRNLLVIVGIAVVALALLGVKNAIEPSRSVPIGMIDWNEELKVQKDTNGTEIDNLRREVEELKKSRASTENTAPPIVLPLLPLLPETKKVFSTSEIVAMNKKFVPSVLCETQNGQVRGSGIVIGKGNDSIYILTNNHITKDVKPSSTGNPNCFIFLMGEGYFAQPVYWPSIASQEEMSLIDFSFLEVKELIPTEEYYYDEITREYTKKTTPPSTELLSYSVFPRICSPDELKIGSELVVLGYPRIGSESDVQASLTITEGIISSEIFRSSTYFVSSAKIDQGNSGGGAFLKSSGCLAGMPTYAATGPIESLGRMINLPKLEQDYLSRIHWNIKSWINQ